MTEASDAALRVTVLDALVAAATEELEKARAEAAPAFKAAVTGLRTPTGAIQVDITLPDGMVIGKLSVKAGAKSARTDETGLHEWTAERNPEALEQYALPEAERSEAVSALLAEKCPDLTETRLKPGALRDQRAIDMLAAEFPDLLSSRVRPGSLAAYKKEAAKAEPGSPKGWLVDQETGERLQLVTETQEPATGAFAFVGTETAERRRQVMAALAAGDPVVRSIAFGGQLAIGPAADASGAKGAEA